VEAIRKWRKKLKGHIENKKRKKTLEVVMGYSGLDRETLEWENLQI
jgi:hypothetical protein